MLNALVCVKIANHRLAAALLAGVLMGASPGAAQEMTAGSVLTELPAKQRFAYLAGLVEGLAYARYRQDDRATEGMACIFEWFYSGEPALNTIDAAFAQYKDHTPGAVMAALIKRRCGE